MGDKCDRCGAEDDDHRTLWHSCFYDMDELDVPFTHEQVGNRKFYNLRVCKPCRAEWMGMIAAWFNAEPRAPEPKGTGIFIRDKGINREVTLEEFEAMQAKNK